MVYPKESHIFLYLLISIFLPIYIYLIFLSICMPIYPFSTYLLSPSPSRSNTAEYHNLDVSAASL